MIHYLRDQGTISPTFWHKAKMRQKSFFGAIQFQQQNYTQLGHYTKLEFALNFYTVGFMLCVSKISVYLLAQKLKVGCWWNWPQGSISPTFYMQLLRQQSCASKVQT